MIISTPEKSLIIMPSTGMLFGRLSSAVILFFSLCFAVAAQETSVKPAQFEQVLDSLKKNGVIPYENRKSPQIKLTTEQSIRFLQQRTRPSYWLNPDDPFRKALNHLLFEASTQKFDSVEKFLRKYQYDSLSIPWDKFYIWEPMRLKIPVVPETAMHVSPDSLMRSDSLSSAVQDLGKSLLKDTTIMVLIDTVKNTTAASQSFPFRYFDYPFQGDSIKVAVQSLLDYIEKRDSTIINITGSDGSSVPVWVNSGSKGTMRRYWLKNEFADSVTVWIGNEGKNTLGLYLEKGINFRKPVRQTDYSGPRVDVQKIDRSKLEKQNIVVKKHYWDYRTESSLVFSQSALSNWVKGGENSVSTALDITGYADFKRPELKLSSNNFARLKMGFMASGGEEVRKNLDLLETNSKLNHKAFGKFDFSAIMLFKTQVAPGKTFTKVAKRDTSYVVSRFMNPATLTIGIGLDYKPNKETSINFSPLSYKGTFVPAAGKITADSLIPGKLDQTRYGVPLGRKSKHEPGASFMISRNSRPFKNLALTNRLQLFTNYIDNPQNIDIDWEMIAVYNLNWFTDLRLNTHLIYDDNTRTTLMRGGAPVYLEDGKTEKKTARSQFKELFGVSLVFRF